MLQFSSAFRLHLARPLTLWERPYRFRLGNVAWETGLNYADSHHWTIDYPEDYDFIHAVYEALYPQNPYFGLDDILTLLDEQPELQTINQQYAGINWYPHYLADHCSGRDLH